MLSPTRLETAAGGPFISSSSARPTVAAQSPNPDAAKTSANVERPSGPPRVITTKPQLAISDQELRARVQWSHKTSPHFALSYDRVAYAEPQVHTLMDTLEEAYSLIFHFTHESFTGRFQVYAVDQRATALLGRAVRPHFNLEERAIYLAQTSSHHAHAELVQYLTHAMRIARYTRHYGHTPGWAVLEDGFSVFLNDRLSILPYVFPFYGADVDLIAHHLQNKHHECLAAIWNPDAVRRGGVDRADSLPVHQLILAGAFFLYLGDTFSDDQVVTFSKSDYAITNETFRDFFHATLEELEQAWLRHLPASLITLTHEEQEEMILRWDRAIECKPGLR